MTTGMVGVSESTAEGGVDGTNLQGFVQCPYEKEGRRRKDYPDRLRRIERTVEEVLRERRTGALLSKEDLGEIYHVSSSRV